MFGGIARRQTCGAGGTASIWSAPVINRFERFSYLKPPLWPEVADFRFFCDDSAWQLLCFCLLARENSPNVESVKLVGHVGRPNGRKVPRSSTASSTRIAIVQTDRVTRDRVSVEANGRGHLHARGHRAASPCWRRSRRCA